MIDLGRASLESVEECAETFDEWDILLMKEPARTLRLVYLSFHGYAQGQKSWHFPWWAYVGPIVESGTLVIMGVSSSSVRCILRGFRP